VRAKGQTVYVVRDMGLSVKALEFLKEDDLFCYCRYRGETCKGSSYVKMFVFDDEREALEYAVSRLEEQAEEHRRRARGEE
jgi:hypothetical protein